MEVTPKPLPAAAHLPINPKPNSQEPECVGNGAGFRVGSSGWRPGSVISSWLDLANPSASLKLFTILATGTVILPGHLPGHGETQQEEAASGQSSFEEGVARWIRGLAS